MDGYFYDNPVISHYLDKQRHTQNVKNQFRDALHNMDIFYKAKIGDIIDNSTLTQSICNYVMKNFADFLAEHKKTENDFRGRKRAETLTFTHIYSSAHADK